jgi:hypothetical protein
MRTTAKQIKKRGKQKKREGKLEQASFTIFPPTAGQLMTPRLFSVGQHWHVLQTCREQASVKVFFFFTFFFWL